MNELKICKHSNGRGWCFVYETYCVEGPCEKEELVEYALVVRCKDCIYWSDDGRCEPTENGLVLEYTSGLDFCSYGERREK